MVVTQTSTNIILGLALVELLNGELTDQTLQLIGTLTDVPAPLNHLVGFIQGASIDPKDREWLITAALAEIADIAREQWEGRTS